MQNEDNNMPMNLKDEIIAGESKVQRDLAAKVQSSFALRAESKRLLEKAKVMVETAIEQGDEKVVNSNTSLVERNNGYGFSI